MRLLRAIRFPAFYSDFTAVHLDSMRLTPMRHHQGSPGGVGCHDAAGRRIHHGRAGRAACPRDTLRAPDTLAVCACMKWSSFTIAIICSHAKLSGSPLVGELPSLHAKSCSSLASPCGGWEVQIQGARYPVRLSIPPSLSLRRPHPSPSHTLVHSLVSLVSPCPLSLSLCPLSFPSPSLPLSSLSLSSLSPPPASPRRADAAPPPTDCRSRPPARRRRRQRTAAAASGRRLRRRRRRPETRGSSCCRSV
jgi:hypothetical protein